MSIHQSLKISGKLGRTRNVLTRAERIEKLIEEGKWDEEEDSVFGLPKVKTVKPKVRKKKKKKKEEEEGEEGAEESLEGEVI